jgi:hypothetical protein
MTYVGGPQPGQTCRIGYFDADNGLYLRYTETGASVVRRSKVSGVVVEEIVPAAEWSHDPLDGTGQSRVTLDHSKSQILWIAFEWLGVGTASIGVVVDGCYLPAHTFYNANVRASVYMSTPCLPVTWEIESDGTATGTLESICCSVMSEGGQQELGQARGISRGGTGLATTATNVYPLLSLRLADGRFDTVSVQTASIVCSTTANFQWSLRKNPTVTGGTAASWASAGSESPLEFDIARTGTISGGQVMAAGYGSSALSQVEIPVGLLDTFGRDAAGVSDEIVLCVGSLAASGETFYGAINVLEPS